MNSVANSSDAPRGNRSKHHNKKQRRTPYVPNLIKPGSRFAELAARPENPGDPEIEITFRVRKSKAPALRSAVEEISTIVGSRLEGSHAFAKEHALTDAAITVGALRAAVFKAVPAGDPHYV